MYAVKTPYNEEQRRMSQNEWADIWPLTDDVDERRSFDESVVVDSLYRVIAGVLWTARREIQPRDVGSHICHVNNVTKSMLVLEGNSRRAHDMFDYSDNSINSYWSI